MAKTPKRLPNRGTFKAGTEAPVKAQAAANNQARYRDQVTQVLISILSEVDKETNKAKLYLMLDRLVNLGLGVEIKIKGHVHHYPPDLRAISTILDRLIGKPKQQIDIEPSKSGGLVMIFGPNEDGDEE